MPADSRWDLIRGLKGQVSDRSAVLGSSALSKATFCCHSLAGIAVSNPAGGMVIFLCECYVLPGRGLFDGPITRLEESYQVYCVLSGCYDICPFSNTNYQHRLREKILNSVQRVEIQNSEFFSCHYLINRSNSDITLFDGSDIYIYIYILT